ncbi:predicted protein [Histoplasma capsulatum G186AR]|uniref:Uncharacterized protein n=1 Tax=Ajellomyces capsulatus (strain G186AR / H82 / ATCC MYA-2454 / RMSCC 2432) TaxID=447093 RepID=C0NX85_AJECG|nr:uncharacterized protein HCBG_08077 [Histoplasma capsulatum G186AR]EEH03951.1 predicted protein [Histoplasma capsulatum G186AR]
MARWKPLSPSSSQTARKIAHTRLSSSREKPRTQPIRGTLNNAKPRSIQKGQTEPERNHGRAVALRCPPACPGERAGIRRRLIRAGGEKIGPAYIDKGREAVSIQ